MSAFCSVIAVYSTKLLRLLLRRDGGRESAPSVRNLSRHWTYRYAGLVRASRLPVRPGTLEVSMMDERLERIVRALLPMVGAVVLIILLGFPPAVTDTTAPSDATNTASFAPFPETQARFLSSTAVFEAPTWAIDDVRPKTPFPVDDPRPPIEIGARVKSRADATQIQTVGVPREFYFSRVFYNGRRSGFYGGRGSWRTDFPRADQIFLSFIDRLVPNLDAFEQEFVVRLDDPDVRRFPFLYALEVGGMSLRPEEIQGLRDYLLAGGFLVIDDFWGDWEWARFEYEIRQVLPEYEIVDLPLDHKILTAFYEIDEIIQVPNVNSGCRGGRTDEGDNSFIPMVKGIHDSNGRLMVVINFNTDLGDAWEWADQACYPFEYSKYAYEMGVNFIVYAMSH